jgi:hypothetical protein
MDGQVDADPSSYAWYDIYVRQTVPLLVAANFGGVTEAQVVCVAPNKVAEGGREPAQRSAGPLGRSSCSWSVVAASIVLGAVSIYL